MQYPTIKAVKSLENKQLWIEFKDGSQKVYDCSPLLHKPAFAPLQHEALFKMVKVDQGGYGISWNDDIDLAESELWLNGVDIAA